MHRARRVFGKIRVPLLMLCGVITVFWKLVLTRQYTFVDNPDLAEQVLPWLNAQVFAIRHGSVLLWDPYAWFGQSLIGQLLPSVASPFTFLLAIAPLQDGHIQLFYVGVWLVFIHCVAAVFAYWFFRDLGCLRASAALGGLFYATAGFAGNTEWPQMLAATILSPMVFLFLLRSLRGRAPVKNAAWAGVALGCSWLGGHHGPPLMLSMAVAGVCLGFLFHRDRYKHVMRRAAIVLLFAGAVSAVQILPTAEYGKASLRWTETGVLHWNQPVEFPEHAMFSLKPTDLLQILVPGNAVHFDPFAGVAGLSMAALAVMLAFGRREVKLFFLMAIVALLYSMARFNAVYGMLYALIPLVEKARSPVVGLSVFHFALTALVALGTNVLLLKPEAGARLQKPLLWFAGVTFAILYLIFFFRPTLSSGIADGDPRAGMIALVAILLAALLQAWRHGHIRAEWVAVLLCLLVIIEQGNEVGYGWAQKHDENRNKYIRQFDDSRDVALFLKRQPNPKRVELNRKDLEINFGDWYRIETVESYTASMPEQTMRLNWWQDRLSQMYGVNYAVSKAPTRPGQRELFSGAAGLKVFANADAFPRAWTVHGIRGAKDEDSGAALVRDGKFDLRKEAVMVGAQPKLDTCAAADAVNATNERESSVRVRVYMACRGMLIVSDNNYPGWRATVDGQSARIWEINTALRGVVVEAGSHEVTMRYRPASVYFGLALTLLGLAGAIVLQRRPEADGLDLMP
jgi:hypothetical protein